MFYEIRMLSRRFLWVFPFAPRSATSLRNEGRRKIFGVSLALRHTHTHVLLEDFQVRARVTVLNAMIAGKGERYIAIKVKLMMCFSSLSFCR